MEQFQFPKNFYFGAATSAHQVEGENHNDWTEWEHANSARLATDAASRNAKAPMRIPDYILKNYPNLLQEENYISGRACDQYNRFREDFDIAKSLGHNAHRFSIEWSRIEPEEGKFNEAEIEHYREVIKALRGRGIEPFVTLWHWTLPVWLSRKGGVLNGDFRFVFNRYIRRMVSEFKNDVNYWITLNEPMVYAKISYLEGRWPPQKKNLLSFLRVSRRLVRVHRGAYGIIKNIQPGANIGIAHNMSPFVVGRKNLINFLIKKFGEWRKNFWFLNAISCYQDFIGFNYYSSYVVDGGLSKIKTARVSDMGWSIDPEGVYKVICGLKKYGKPVYITENGIADSRDIERAMYIEEHLRCLAKAIEEGADVRGYFHWSLLDNFEWSDGFWPRFGLVEIDYKTMKRKIRPSAWKYKEIIQNGIFL